MTTTPEQRAAWLGLAEAATPGEWTASYSYVWVDGEFPVATTETDSDHYGLSSTVERKNADAAFIAAARTALPELIAEVEAMQAVIRNRLPSVVWSLVRDEFRYHGDDEAHAMARADVVRIEVGRWLDHPTGLSAALEAWKAREVVA